MDGWLGNFIPQVKAWRLFEAEFSSTNYLNLPNTPHHSSYLAENLAVIAIDWFKGWVGG